MYKKQVKFGHKTYRLNTNIKKYALRDCGFNITKNDNFKFSHPIYIDSPYKPIGLLKIDVNKDLTKFDMFVVGEDEMTKLNVFVNQKLEPAIILIDYILKDLIEHDILMEVKNNHA